MKQQVIFVCGPDRCGKTQIAKALAKHLNVPYYKATSEHQSYKLAAGLVKFPKELPSELWRDHPITAKLLHSISNNPFFCQLLYADPRTFDLFNQGGFSMVFDRGFPCEAVYSQVFNRPTNEEQLRLLDESWASIGARIVICTRSSYQGLVDDIDPRIDAQKLQQLDDAYKVYSQTSICKTLLLNVDDENLKRELHDILNWIDWTKEK